MISGINEGKISWNRKVKVRPFSGASSYDMRDNLKPLLRKAPDNIILHIGTCNLRYESSTQVVDEILAIKNIIKKTLPNSNVIVSNIIERLDDPEASLCAKEVNDHLSKLKIDIIDNSNIGKLELCKEGLHLNEWRSGKLAVNFIKRIKKYRKKSYSSKK